jgi:hypothetical protein
VDEVEDDDGERAIYGYATPEAAVRDWIAMYGDEADRQALEKPEDTTQSEVYLCGRYEGRADVAARLRARVRPFVLRRLKREVAPELPPRTESVLHVTLDEHERAVYDAVLAATRTEVVALLEQSGGGAKVRRRHEWIEQVHVRRPAVEPLVAQSFARRLHLGPYLLGRHKGNGGTVLLCNRGIERGS